MLVSCPTCPAEYEIAESDIGPEGRVVECSACGARWLQPAPTAETSKGDSSIPGLAEARRSLDDLKDAPAPRPESLYGDDDAEPEAPPPPAPVAVPEPTPIRRGAGPDLSPARPIEDVAVDPDDAPRRSARRGGDLPDAARLNAELRASAHEEERVERRRRGGFRTGLLLMLIIGGIGAGLYHGRDEIVELVPQAEAPLDSYRTAVDDGKAQAMVWADQAMAKIKPMIGGEEAAAPAPTAEPAPEPAPEPEPETAAPAPAAPVTADPASATPAATAPDLPASARMSDPAPAPMATPALPAITSPGMPSPAALPSTPGVN